MIIGNYELEDEWKVVTNSLYTRRIFDGMNTYDIMVFDYDGGYTTYLRPYSLMLAYINMYSRHPDHIRFSSIQEAREHVDYFLYRFYKLKAFL